VAERPHDMTDLYLAPVALELDARLEELANLSADDLGYQVILETDIEPRDTAERRKALVETSRRGAELHGWTVSLHERGLAVSHDDHSFVLGLPANLREYIRD
jgi:hypothetical protein